MFKEVTFSYNILSDPDKRRQYDTAGFEVRYVKEVRFFYNIVSSYYSLEFFWAFEIFICC